ncbi:Endo-1,6-beta-D-glucanase [Fulvia fulva]|uniref:Endo-1,6-beta-D-glucanase n=1 Tax=Passalora fulva TaxID=5499 RepID=A0A9Q8L7V5_PASFU|nr:Endo-1,6-beta-D-glucanase [Fulvia fulva]KAK4634342.1 Endo-1,6-beta-D-glucanase [Fulvia fulva]KAK4638206.1 Endo-1,6-beta-D-glucanase [Fulvia fulva]UJO12339.1 Endo-1,6-beta-D-glucanase [Fulvia fulva]WPV10121.1 Endo-1,6-beta-D-glucanase [Fulvia fulva]WPV25350.1 Endo-1,6-beta-D-glucanase [Fulvia fulva]
MGMMRHTIGSSDMSGNQYSFDDNGPSFNEGQPDLDLSNFDLTDDGEAMVKLLAKMGSHKSDVLLAGAPWSFPGWMKHNGLFIAPRLNTGTSYNILNNSFDVQYIPQIIKYFTKYIDTYAEYGVTVNGLPLMNEPLNYQGGYPCMFLDVSDAAAILSRGLGAALADRNVALMAYDHNTDQAVYPSQGNQRAPGLV